MSHDKLRNDTECQNCGHTVAEIYCPHCGQKNSETRQSFAHLTGHVIEDITHYDSGFWRTIKHLIFRPGKLTIEYLLGKRQQYVPPVKLYIFISFVAFFLPGILPAYDNDSEHGTLTHEAIVSDHPVNGNNQYTLNINTTKEPETKAAEVTEIKKSPSLNKRERVFIGLIKLKDGQMYIHNPVSYTSVSQMDSIEKLKQESLRISKFEYKIAKKLIHLYHKNSPGEVGTMVANAFPHNLSKAIFIYMPIFAIWLWLFHGKKRWYFFDHCIFTLHYFSFLLLTSTLLILFYKLVGFTASDSIFRSLFAVSVLFVLLWQVFYFYRSHRKMYGEKLLINFIKSTGMFFINFASILFVLLLFLIYTYHNLH